MGKRVILGKWNEINAEEMGGGQRGISGYDRSNRGKWKNERLIKEG